MYCQTGMVGFSQSTACTPIFTSFSEGECLSNDFLSAQSLFGSPLVSSLGNVTTEIAFTNTSLLAVRWLDGQCQNVIEEVSMKIGLNDSLIVEAQLSSIKYSTLTAQNYSEFKQKFTINFNNSLEPEEDVKKIGYQQGDEIYAMRGE
ncbi:hypothetical protein COOONC_07326 [Cooperia oncophora]